MVKIVPDLEPDSSADCVSSFKSDALRKSPHRMHLPTRAVCGAHLPLDLCRVSVDLIHDWLCPLNTFAIFIFGWFAIPRFSSLSGSLDAATAAQAFHTPASELGFFLG